MAIAKLTIDLDARLAGLQAGLDKAGYLAQKTADQVSKSFGGINLAKNIAGGTIVADLARDLGRKLVQFVPNVVNGLDALNDLSDATGSSIERLSALEDRALRTGTSVETAGDAVIKLNKALASAKPGSDQAKAIEALGLSVEKLRALDPVDAFEEIAKALAKYDNNAAKSRFTTEFLGKSYAALAPLLKDVAERGRLVGTVTKEQAEQAEKFNIQLFELQKNLLDLARNLSGPVIKGLNDFSDAIKKDGFFGGFAAFSGLDKVPESVERVTAAYRLLGLARERITPLQILDKDPTNAKALAELERIDAVAKSLAKTIPKLNADDAKSKFLRGDKDTSPVKLPSLKNSLFDGKDKATARAFDAGTGMTTAMVDALKGLESTDVAKIAAVNAELDALFEIRASGLGGGSDLEERVKTLRDELEKLNGVTKSVALEPAKMTQALADALGELEDTDAAKIQQLSATLDELFKQRDLGVLDPTAVNEAIERVRNKIKDVGQTTKETAKDAGAEIGLVFASAAGEAITKWEGFGNLLKSIAADVAQIGIRTLVTKPLEKYLTEQLSGFSLSSLLFSAKGNAFGPGGVMAFASGGVVSGATPFRFGGGRLGVMGEKGPEGILPLARGRDGKLGVRSQGGGGVSVNYSPIINIDSRTDQAAIAQTVAQAVAVGQQQLMQQLKDSGAI